MYNCDRCGLDTDTLYRYENELLCPLCIINIPDEELKELED